MSTTDDRVPAASPELRELIERAWGLFEEMSEPGAPASAFVVTVQDDERSMQYLPRDAERRDERLARALSAPGDALAMYVLVWLDDGRVVAEAEERGAGFALRLARSIDANHDEGARFSGPADVLGRRANRLVGESLDVVAEPPLLIMEAMLCVAHADAHLTDDELAQVRALAESVPLFSGHDPSGLFEAARAQYSQSGGLSGALRHVELLRSELRRRQAWILAVETARVAGTDGRREQAVLNALGDALSITDEFVTLTERILANKYEREAPLDHALLGLVAMAVITADGAFDRAEMTALEALGTVVPELADEGAMARLGDAQRELQAAGGALRWVGDIDDDDRFEALDAQQSATVMALAVELACASDGIDPRENRVLVTLAGALGVAPDWLDDARQVFEVKYAE